MPTTAAPSFTVETYREFQPHDVQEWVLSNGLGGYAAATVLGMNTRRYHGLLCAATVPPVGRVMLVNRVAEELTVGDGGGAPYELSINTFSGGVLHPRGDRHLVRFEVGDLARWTYDVDGVTVVKEVQVLWGRNVTAVRYTVDAGDGRPFRLAVSPFASLRDFHGLRRAAGADVRAEAGDRTVELTDGGTAVSITADAGRFEAKPDWWYGFVYPAETERGQDDREDLFTPGAFVLAGTGYGLVTLWMSNDAAACGDWDAELTARSDAIAAACTDPANAASHAPGRPHPVAAARSPAVGRLFRAANDFVVARKTPDGRPGTSVIAGYPWFADWGRDSMISLPGLLLTTGRYRQAKEVLTVFAQYVDGGMIPNRFDDYTNEPEFNTVDASLWFIHAAHEYARLSGDDETFDRDLLPACQQIVAGYRAGTRYHIKVDPGDGLVSQGDADTQLTWMDARCNGVAFTPRQGKPVEINALWYHALLLLGEDAAAEQVSASFKAAYWLDDHRGLADGIDGGKRDERVRPNQIFAVSLPNSPLTHDQQWAVVDVVRRALLTPFGLRTLTRSDPGYRPVYTGDQWHRDGAYHNGTVWPWLIGPFLDAWLKVNRRSPGSTEQAREWLRPLVAHMADEGAIGQIAEIFDGDPPHRPVGCFAQAWSVAEVLRLAVELGV